MKNKMIKLSILLAVLSFSTNSFAGAGAMVKTCKACSQKPPASSR